MKPLVLLLVTCAVLTACRGLSKHYIPLTATALYNPDSVRLAVDGGDQNAADKKLAAATDRFRKAKDTTGSIPLYKDAILASPSAKGYFELSGPLLASHQYDEAIRSLGMAEKLGYTPLANVMFRYAYAYAHIGSGDNDDENEKATIRFMQLALQMGYAHPEEFLRKEFSPKPLRHSDFMRAFNETVAGMAGRNPEKSLWDSYSTQFSEVTLPLVVNMDWIRAHPLDDEISFEFERFIPEMRSAKFEREGGNVYYYVALVKKDPAYVAVVYGSEYEGADPPELDSANIATGAVKTLTPTFYLITYDRHGKIIDQLLVAGRADLTTPFKAFALRADMHFQVQDFGDEYKDPEKAGLDSSNYIGLKAETPVNYLIDASGKFVKTDAPLAVR